MTLFFINSQGQQRICDMPQSSFDTLITKKKIHYIYIRSTKGPRLFTMITLSKNRIDFLNLGEVLNHYDNINYNNDLKCINHTYNNIMRSL